MVAEQEGIAELVSPFGKQTQGKENEHGNANRIQ